MISENILGETRKWQAGTVHWQAKVVEIDGDSAWVQITSKDGKSGTQSMTRLRWSAGELSDHGFEI
jgi:thioredoxin reductase